MKLRILNVFLLFGLISTTTFAQHRKAQTYQQQVQDQRNENVGTRTVTPTTFRFLANLEYASSSPTDFNDARASNLWGATTASPESFGSYTGFSVGAGYYIWEGFVGIELENFSKNFSSANITPTATFVQDSFEFETILLTYDWVYQEVPEHSFEIGLGLGQATKYKFSNIFTGSLNETLVWSDTPFVYKVRAFYNYHFSQHVRFRAGAAYEGISSNKLKLDEDHAGFTFNGQPATSGLTYEDANGNGITVNMSGLRASVGLAVAF